MSHPLPKQVEVPAQYLRFVFRGRERLDEETLASFGLDRPGQRVSIIEKAEHEAMRSQQQQAHAPQPQPQPSPAPPTHATPDTSQQLTPAEREAIKRIDEVTGKAHTLATEVRFEHIRHALAHPQSSSWGGTKGGVL